VSSPKEPDQPKKPKSNFSRRGFLAGMGVTSGALTTGILENEAQAAPAAKVVGPGEVPITLTINNKPYNVNVEPRSTLLDTLRNRLDLTAAKRVCDRGTCGACTVIVDGKVMYSCTVLAIDAQGKKIETLEGVSAGRRPHPVSVAFVNNDAQQCGYCTAGFVMAAKGFLDRNPNPTMDDVKQGLGGNLCRCGTYMGVRKAVVDAAKAIQQGGRNA
jgi:xanthine dehydrogenase YagT iron-sulfur-binding subunit